MASVASPPPQPHPYVRDRARLDALRASGLLSADLDPALDRWTRLAAGLIGAPTALLSLVDEDRQYFKSHVGLAPSLADERETPLSHSFCQHVVATQAPLVVTDARVHPVVRDNLAVEDIGILAYAGQPITTSDGFTLGSFCVIDTEPRSWSEHDLSLLDDLAAGLIAEIELRAALRTSRTLQGQLAREARTDALTGLPNRRQLIEDLGNAVAGDGPAVFAMFDLNGFKAYNDLFGHPAGDALLARLGQNLQTAVAPAGGTAYRLGGDEFCVLVADENEVERATAALSERSEAFAISSSHGSVRLDGDQINAEEAMRAADQALYSRKDGRVDAARRQAQDVLVSVLREREPELDAHVREVSALSRRLCLQLGLETAEVDEVVRGAQLHDIGKIAVPDSILNKPGRLDHEEWAVMAQHTLVGERILSAAPALRNVASMVRSSHERWDGGGYPDGLRGTEIPLGARIVFVCDTFDAITAERPYSRARSAAEAFAELRRHAGSQFDPDVVAAFVEAMDAGHPSRSGPGRSAQARDRR